MRFAGRGTKFGIHQVLVGASYGDAVTNVALEFRDALRRVGPSEVFAHYVDPAIAVEVKPLHDFGRDPRGILVYHSSIGDPAMSDFLMHRREPIVLVYHNITPSSYFQGWDNRFAALLDQGRRDLRELRHRTRLAFADSKFNARDLEQLGYQDVRVLPPIVDPFRLVRAGADFSVLEHFGLNGDAPNLLFVGQLLPHKRVDLLLEAMYVLNTYMDPEISLLLVGRNEFTPYRNAITAQVHELGLRRVHFLGSVNDRHLAALFRTAAAYATTTDHEGFCVPLLEAMAFETPVFARACAAVPETAGNAALLVPDDASPTLIAEAIARVLDDRDLRATLAARGSARLDAFDADRARTHFLAGLAEVA
jgi:glycosyltransferase involved in cell wall biosynthesis